MKLKLMDIYNGLLLETVERNKIIDAIENRKVITILYDGDETINKGLRDIEPFCYGINHHGNVCIRAWQIAGVSDTPQGKPHDPLTRIAGWRMFRVDRIHSFIPTGDVFNEARPKYNPRDKDMTTIYKAVSFPTTAQPQQPAQPQSGQQQPQQGQQAQQKPKSSVFGGVLDRFKQIMGRK